MVGDLVVDYKYIGSDIKTDSLTGKLQINMIVLSFAHGREAVAASVWI